MIAGRVLDSETRQGVPGSVVMLAGVRLASGDGGAVGRPGPPVRTDSQGRFAFPALPAGNYIVQAQLDGYAGNSGAAVREVELADGAIVPDVKIQLIKLATIAGTVRDDAGDPVVGVDVVAFHRTRLQGRPPVLAEDGRARTNDRGQYRLTGLLPGEYYVCACNRDPIPFDGQLLTTLASRPLDLLGVAGRAAKVGADTASLDATLRTYAPTFHPNATLVTRAERVKVSGADPKASIDIGVSAVRASRVSGRVIGVPATGLPASAVRLTRNGDVPEAAAIAQIVPMLVQPDGRFDFAGVPPGQYTLDVRTVPGTSSSGPGGAALAFIGSRGAGMGGTRGGGPGGDPLWASQIISVGDEDVTGLMIALQPGATITGRLEFAGNGPPPQPGPATMARANRIQLNSAEPPPRFTQAGSTVDEDGTFRIPGVIPGRYVVVPSIALPGWPTLKSVTLGGVDITDMILDVDGRDLSNLVVTVSDAPMAEIRGTVASSGDPEIDTWVRAFPAERRFWEEPFGAFARFKGVRADGKNAFTITRLPAGEYFVIAVTEGGLEWMDKTTLEVMSRSAQRIRVVNGDKKVLEVRR